jgi:GntR family transcriptional regulator/MocR family aminotransferase
VAGGVALMLHLDPSASSPLYRQVYDGLREAILAGRLRPGERLPATRALAADLGVARNTVILAFEQLRAEGYLVGRRGAGTRVRATLPDALLSVRSPSAGARAPAGGSASAGGRAAVGSTAVAAHAPEDPRSSAGGAPSESTSSPIRLSRQGAILVAAGAAMVRRGGKAPVPFRLGVPALDAFPARLWARLTARRWRGGGIYLGDGDPAGQPELRAAIADYVANARGARCSADQVVVVGGIQHGVDLMARVLLDPGDPVWVEDPGYLPAHAVLRAAGARLVPVPVDDEGLDIAAGERAAPAARLAHVTPSHQFPLGAVLSAPRRLALLDWARRADAWVVEDDYDSEFRYAGRPLPCLQGLEATRLRPGCAARVLYLGTFSKTLVPGLRLGYLIVPEALVEPMRAARGATDWHAPTPQQSVLADFIGEGHYARHLRRVRALYAERQATLIAAAEAELADHLTLAPDQAGLHLVGWLPLGADDQQAAAAAATEGVLVYPISNYRLTRMPAASRGGLLLGYAGFDDAALRKGIGRLRLALEAVPS